MVPPQFIYVDDHTVVVFMELPRVETVIVMLTKGEDVLISTQTMMSY